MKIRWYFLRFAKGIGVTFRLTTDHDVTWTRIYGVQIGGWFFGAVKSAAGESSDASIDYADIPALSGEQIAAMKRGSL